MGVQSHEINGLGDRGARRAREAALDVEVLAHGQVRVCGRGFDEVADVGEHVAHARSNTSAQDFDVTAAWSDEPAAS